MAAWAGIPYRALIARNLLLAKKHGSHLETQPDFDGKITVKRRIKRQSQVEFPQMRPHLKVGKELRKSPLH